MANFATHLYETEGYSHGLANQRPGSHGQDVIVALSLNDDQAREKYGSIDIKLSYLRTTHAPQ